MTNKDSGFAGLAFHENAKLISSGFTCQVNDYDLDADQHLEPSPDVNCITLVSSGGHEANVARAADGTMGGRQISWGRLGFVTAGMPASFTTGTCQLQACHLIFANAKVEMLVGSPVSWVVGDLAGFLNIGDRTILSSMRRLRREALSPGPAHDNMVEAISEAIVIDLYRRFSSQRDRSSRYGSKLAGWQSRKIEDYVQAHFADGAVPVMRLAEICGISASHLGRSFKNTAGTTLPAYIETLRMDRARVLLADRKLTVAQVASACGYTHQGNFSTTFRRVFGLTPGNFRRRRYGSNPFLAD